MIWLDDLFSIAFCWVIVISKKSTGLVLDFAVKNSVFLVVKNYIKKNQNYKLDKIVAFSEKKNGVSAFFFFVENLALKFCLFFNHFNLEVI